MGVHGTLCPRVRACTREERHPQITQMETCALTPGKRKCGQILVWPRACVHTSACVCLWGARGLWACGHVGTCVRGLWVCAHVCTWGICPVAKCRAPALWHRRLGSAQGLFLKKYSAVAWAGGRGRMKKKGRRHGAVWPSVSGSSGTVASAVPSVRRCAAGYGAGHGDALPAPSSRRRWCAWRPA